MATRNAQKITFEPEQVIEPIYTGGSVALSQDGRILATCMGEDVLLTDIFSGARLAKVEGDGEPVTTLAITPTASHLITCSRSQSMRIYSIDSSTPSNGLDVELLRTLKPHTSPVITSTVDKSGTLLATGGADGIVKVWDIRGGYTTHTLHGHSGVISSLHFFEVDVHDVAKDLSGTKKKRKRTDSRPGGEDEQAESSVGYRLASGSEDGQVRVWDLQRRKCAAVLQSHVSVVRALHYSRAHNLLLSGSRDKTVILWDAKTWTARNTLPILEGVEAAKFLQNLPFIYTGGEAGRLKIWNHETGQEVTEEQEATSEEESIVDILAVELQSLLISVHVDQTFKIHSTRPLEQIQPSQILPPLPITRQISGAHDDVIDLAYVGLSRNHLAVATNLEEVRILSLSGAEAAQENGRFSSPAEQTYFGSDIGSLKGHEDIVICLDMDWSGQWVATGAKDNTARLWRVDPLTKSFTCHAIFTGHAESLGAVALPRTIPPEDSNAFAHPLDHPPKFLITGSQDKTVKRWETGSTGKENKNAARATYTRKAHEKDINAIDVNHSSSLFASASQDRTVKIWSVEDGEAVGVLRGHKRGVWSVKFAPRDIPPIAGESGQASSARGLVLTSSGDKTVKIWSMSDYSCIRTFEGHTNSVLKVLWMPGNSSTKSSADRDTSSKQSTHIASAGGDGLVKIWDANTGELDATLDNHTDRVWALAFHPETQTLVSGGGDSVITFWKDTTSTTTAAAAAASTARVEQDQQLQNHIRAGSYREAITLALQLDHPARLLSLFSSVVKKFPPEEGSLCGVKAVDEAIGSLADDQLFALLLRVRDWNTNAKTAHVAQRILWALLKLYPASRFTRLKGSAGRKGKSNSVKEVLDALRAYTERHYRRMEDLLDESYLVDYTLREMDVVDLDDSLQSQPLLNGH